MPLYTRSGRVRGTLFPADEPVEAPSIPRVLRGVDAARATPAEDGPMLVPRVLRGAAARQEARAFDVPALTPSPEFLLPDPDSLAPPAEPEPAPEPAPVLPSLDEATIRADESARWHTKLEEAAARARENGYRQGKDDAERATADERALIRESVAREVEAMQTAWKTHLETCESMMANLAFEVAETILGAPLPDNVRRVSSRTLHEAVESLAGSPVKVTVHPVDLLRLEETGVAEELRRAAADVRLDADPNLREGEWHAENDAASVRHLREELLDALRRRLGLLALGKG